ncbi:hypothetical protein ScPMuIL_003167 [Solemya velum]
MRIGHSLWFCLFVLIGLCLGVTGIQNDSEPTGSLKETQCLGIENRVHNHQVLKVGSDYVTLQWRVPERRATVYEFCIEYLDVEGIHYLSEVCLDYLGYGGTMTASVKHLSSNTRYVFRTYAKCVEGKSLFSSAADVTTMDDPPAPQPEPDNSENRFDTNSCEASLIIGGVLSVAAMTSITISIVYVVKYRHKYQAQVRDAAKGKDKKKSKRSGRSVEVVVEAAPKPRDASPHYNQVDEAQIAATDAGILNEYENTKIRTGLIKKNRVKNDSQ